MSKIARKVTALNPDTMFCDTIERAQTLYFHWLVSQVGMDDLGRPGNSSYLTLAQLLHEMEYYWANELNENRAKDGIRLRHIWFDAINNEADALGVGRPMFPLDSLSGPCSVLEMLIGLAMRIESDIMQDDRRGNQAPLWFWRILANLDIAYDDAHLGWDQSIVIREIMTDMMDGRIMLFPVRAKKAPDGRLVHDLDIWWQAQLWLAENYPNEQIGG